MKIWLGNRAAVEVQQSEHPVTGKVTEKRVVLPAGKRCTFMVTPEDMGFAEAFVNITAPGSGAWAYHSDGPPAWVASDNAAMAAALAEHFGCEVRDPDPGPGME